MSSKNNYFCLDRKLLEDSHNWLNGEFDRGKAWVDLIGLARWKDGWAEVRGVNIVVKRGQLCWSMKGLADRWGWSQGRVKRFLKQLKNEDQIEYQISNVTTVITITNYDAYQKTVSKTVSRRRADGEQTETKEEGIESKEGGACTHARDPRQLPPWAISEIAKLPEVLRDPVTLWVAEDYPVDIGRVQATVLMALRLARQYDDTRVAEAIITARSAGYKGFHYDSLYGPQGSDAGLTMEDLYPNEL